MEFMHSGPDIVRSEHQRWLLDHWARMRGHAALADLARSRRRRESSCRSTIWPGRRSSALDGDARFRIGFHGREARRGVRPRSSASANFSTKCSRRRISDRASSTYRQVVSSKVPIYTVSDMRDPAGRIVHHERLLLPFSHGGAETDRILASIEAASPEGPFELRDLMKSPDPAAGNCALHNDPILKCCFPIGWLRRPIFCSTV